MAKQIWFTTANKESVVFTAADRNPTAENVAGCNCQPTVWILKVTNNGWRQTVSQAFLPEGALSHTHTHTHTTVENSLERDFCSPPPLPEGKLGRGGGGGGEVVVTSLWLTSERRQEVVAEDLWQGSIHKKRLLRLQLCFCWHRQPSLFKGETLGELVFLSGC